MAAVVQDVSGSGSDSDDVPELVEGAGDGSAAAAHAAANRNEKKARKAMSKLALKAVPGVTRVVVKRGPNAVLFVINNPEVLRNPTSDSYVVFGRASAVGGGDESQQLQQAASQFTPEMMAQFAAASQASGAGAAPALAAGGDDEGEEVDETGLEAKDIALVMEQAKCSRAKAAKVLRANDGDVVNAIMELSM
jgi:nascent polypeptide-associated complex subunit alpha